MPWYLRDGVGLCVGGRKAGARQIGGPRLYLATTTGIGFGLIPLLRFVIGFGVLLGVLRIVIW